MDHAWAAEQLRVFKDNIDVLRRIDGVVEFSDEMGDVIESYGPYGEIVDRLIMLDPIMRSLMEAARLGLGEYLEAPDEGWSLEGSEYWHKIVRPSVLRAIGIHELGAEARRRMRPDSPDLVADQFHPWVWDAAAPLWDAGSNREAVHAAARSVNARLQQKVRRYDISDTKLCREAFSFADATPHRFRLRLRGDHTSETWRSRQQGAMDFGSGCFEAIRNPAAHDHSLKLTEQEALEQLAALSILARWIQECKLDIGFPGTISEDTSNPKLGNS
jgi:hypothetical protein